MITIAIDLTALSYHITGIERFAMCVAEQMLIIDKNNDYILIFRDVVYPSFAKYIDGKKVKEKIVYGNNKLLFYQVALPISLYFIKADRYLFFAFTSPMLFKHRGIFNTIHDMGPWDASETLKKLQKFYLRITYIWSARVSQGIITISDFSKGRIAEILKYPKEKIKVVPCAAYEGVINTTRASFDEVKKKYLLPNKYIMSLSTLEPRKNIIILLQAFVNIMDKVDYDLVLVGRNGWKMNNVLKKYNAQSRIKITGFVKDEHVSQIYKNAMCFVFPSLYEGFGIPPVEALALGIPVIASDAASIPEVLMGQAVYFRNNSIGELEEILRTLNNTVDNMPKELNKYQKENYNFRVSAKKIIEFINISNNRKESVSI